MAERLRCGEAGLARIDDAAIFGRMTSEYGRIIYPCKACVSTAMPLCHWPCSHAIRIMRSARAGDWMAEIYRNGSRRMAS